MALPDEERVPLLGRLMMAFPTARDEDDHESQEEVDAAWDAEIKRRLQEIDEGTVEMIPHEQVMAELDRIVEGHDAG